MLSECRVYEVKVTGVWCNFDLLELVNVPTICMSLSDAQKGRFS
jgi:hypothetical protein